MNDGFAMCTRDPKEVSGYVPSQLQQSKNSSLISVPDACRFFASGNVDFCIPDVLCVTVLLC